MASFEKSRGKRNGPRDSFSSRSGKDSRDSYSSRGSRDSYQRRDNRGGRGSREFRSNNRDRHEVEMTKVTCSSCGEKCEVPFKPTSSKPVYCASCFAKKDKVSSDNSSRDLDLINEKLNKIMIALKIE
jgi:CxxC-x17-CxxC domain-containing protein